MNGPFRTFEFERDTALQDVLFAHGVEFPCGGRGRCKRCRVRVVEGDVPATPEQEAILSPAEIEAGWRLACHARASGRVTLEIAQWEASILADDSPFAFTPREGHGVAVDIGTTTLVAQVVDLETGAVVAVRSALNPQAAYGADIMSRVEFATAPEGRRKLHDLIRTEVAAMIPLDPRIRDIALVGNTVMHHLFCDIDVEPLAHVPFEPVNDGLVVLPGDPPMRFLPCLGGFVGSDVLAGILATNMDHSEALQVLVDLGTNGEIVVGNRERMLCASTAAGPAFEGGRISMGMRAATGAIAEVAAGNGGFRCHVLGGGAARGICGSGLVDAAALAVERGLIAPNGRLRNGPIALAGPVVITQQDIRELQLAKGATAAGVQILLRQWGATAGDVDRVWLAGAFGNYLNRASARRIGLLDFPIEKIEPAGNTALLGAKMALFTNGEFAGLRARVRHVPLASDPQFEDEYIAGMTF